MPKKFIAVITLMSMFFLSGCEYNNKEIIHESSNYPQKIENKPEIKQESNNSYQNKTEHITEEDNGPINKNNKTVDISIDDVKGISELDAVQLCIDSLGVINEMTGFKMGYRPVGAVEYRDKQYYVIYAAWYIDDANWIYIGYHLVSANGDIIYDCEISRDGTYYVSRKLWSK